MALIFWHWIIDHITSCLFTHQIQLFKSDYFRGSQENKSVYNFTNNQDSL